MALGGTFGALTLTSERRGVEERSRAHAKYIAALVGMTLRSHVEAVAMVAQSPAFDGDRPDVARFNTLVIRILRGRPEWQTVSVADAAGNRLLRATARGAVVADGRVTDIDSLHHVVETGRAQIGRMAPAPDGGEAFAVRAPVGDAGHVRFIVTALVPVSQLSQLLAIERLPVGWSASVVDSAGQSLTVPALRAPDTTQPSPVEIWAPVSGAHWSVRITTPAQAFTQPMRRAMVLMAVAALICLLLVALLARMLTSELRQLRGREAAELQSQRMEALGRLTGGVAHDFNNLLTPIIIGLEMIGRRAVDERMARQVEAAAASAERARLLVSRLLSFSRQQTLSPTAIDLDRLLRDMADLIEKSLTPSIALEIAVDPAVPPAKADQAQLELAILNLIINARDAMPRGGQLRISVAAASEAQIVDLTGTCYVSIAVADTGSGMDPATMAKATDPFFTTKPVDQGTGLGLSMVHGFAAQSGGALRLESVPGLGTTATILLPCGAGDVAAAPPTQHAGAVAAGARLLLVDDDDRVRRAGAEVLAEAGYTVVEARSVDEALAVLRDDAAIGGVVTDLVMPGRSGTELIDDLHRAHPHLPVLLVTGHVAAEERLPAGVRVLRKPFRPADLLAAVGAMTMRAPEAGAAPS